MVALSCSATGLLSSLPTLAEGGRLRGEDREKNEGKNKGMDRETVLEHDGNPGESHAITMTIRKNNNNNVNSNDNDNNDTSNNDNTTTYNNNNDNDMPATGAAPAAWTATGQF